MSKQIHIIGSGFSSMAAACYLAKAGHQVTVFEKNDTVGGRARQLARDGFTFDIGPTWYWMPDVFERFFADFGKQVSDYYSISKLAPGYQVYFGKDDWVTISDNLQEIISTFEALEPGSGQRLKKFIDRARSNYDIAIRDLVYKPGVSPFELVNVKTAAKIGEFFSNIRRDVRRNFRNPKLVSILEFPVLFLGAKPADTPSFYSFMNYADFGLGTWHPREGMYSVVKGIRDLALSLGVRFRMQTNVSEIRLEGGKAIGIMSNDTFYPADIVLSGADYHHTETLLPASARQYSQAYWEKKVFAPSSLLFYVGFDRKIENVSHHTLFFDVDFDQHAHAIYDRPKWPDEPLFYASFPSKTDRSAAPDGKEAGIFLIPLAPGLDDSGDQREIYFEKIMSRFEAVTGQRVRESVLFKESFCVSDFVREYNSYKGNAYGMANTLLQTHFLRPGIKSSKIKNLYFTGQLTVPGPGVPPALISGKLAAELIEKGS